MKRILPALSAVLFLLVLIFAINSCGSSPRTVSGELSAPALPAQRPLVLTFAGDIMAHTVNYHMKEYDRIYDDVRSFLLSDDLTFGNLEMPVADTLPESTYPRFNVHNGYVRAAMEGGFDVFSLANNHSNDQGAQGISETRTFMESISTMAFSSGLRTVSDEAMKPVMIVKNGWKVLFLSVTEILNSYDATGKLVYYSPPTASGRELLLGEIRRIRAENPCDIFILSIHLNEPEYVRTVGKAKKDWFARLADAGVDIVWGNHPHVMQTWETSADAEIDTDGSVRSPVLFMYSMGNFISGQRYTPNRDKPDDGREYTGDAVLLRVTVSRNGNSASPGAVSGYSEMSVKPVLITNYTDPENGAVVRLFDTAFMNGLSAKWFAYYRERQRLMEEYLPLLSLQSIPAILE